MSERKLRVGVLISGRGSNMAALVEAAAATDYPAEIVGVVSNKADAGGLAYAAARGIPTAVVDHKAYPDRESFDRAVDAALEGFGVEFIALAGFMRIFSPWFPERWSGRMLNIHPSLLPSYPGLHTHARALADGARVAGCTVHFVTAELDSGPIVAQGVVPVLPGDGPDDLANRILAIEHRIYPTALALVASGAVRLENGRLVTAPDVPIDPSATLIVPSTT